MFLKTCTSTLLLSIALVSFGQADKVLSFTLEEAVQFALQNNTQAKNSELDAQINKKRTLEIITTGLPQLTLNMKYQHDIDQRVNVVAAGSFTNDPFPFPAADTAITFGLPHNVNADFMITQLIVDGRYFIGLKATRTINAISQEQIKLTDTEVRANVSKAYYAVLVAQEGQTIVKRNLETLKKLLYETTELYQAGFAEELDVDRLQLQLSNMETMEKKTSLQFELAKNLLKYHMAIDYTIDIVLTENLDALLASNPVDADAAFNYETRTEYRLLGLQYNMRGYDAQRIRAAYFPSIVGFAGYGWNAQRQEFNIFDFDQKWFNTSYWGVEIQVPIFDSYRNGAIYQQKKLEQQKIKNQLEDFKQASNLQVSQTKMEYKTALDEYQNQQENLKLAEKIYDKVKTMYQEGIGSSLELANAEASLSQTQASFINAMYELLVKRVELEKALGNY